MSDFPGSNFPVFAIVDDRLQSAVTSEINDNHCLALFQQRDLADVFLRQTFNADQQRPLTLQSLTDAGFLSSFLMGADVKTRHVIWYGTSQPGRFQILPIDPILDRLAEANPPSIDLPRLNVCLDVHRKMVQRWQRCQEYFDIVTAAQLPVGNSVEKIRRIPLSVTIDGETTVVVLKELMIVLELIRSQVPPTSDLVNPSGEHSAPTIKTEFTQEEAYQLLLGCPIIWPEIPIISADTGQQINS